MEWTTPDERLAAFEDLDKQLLLDRFNEWESQLDTLSAGLLDRAPEELRARLDYSVDSLLVLGIWLLSEFQGRDELVRDNGGRTLQEIHAYLAKTLVPASGGALSICLDEEDIDFAVPVIVFPEGLSIKHTSFGNYPTAVVHRRDGAMLYDLAKKWQARVAGEEVS